MLLPKIYAVDDRNEIAAFIRAHSFATVVGSIHHPSNLSVSAMPPVAAHVPLLYSADDDKIVLRGHLTASNPLVESMRITQTVVAIFVGPHGYISPTWYGDSSIPPTWNFTAAHLSGAVTLLEDDLQKTDILRETVATYERSNNTNWTFDVMNDDMRRMLPMIIAFEIKVDKVQCCYKLSQNRNPADRDSVIRNLRNKNQPDTKLLADWMAAKASPRGSTHE